MPVCVSHSTRRSLFNWKSFYDFSIFPIGTYESCAEGVYSQDERKCRKNDKKNDKNSKKSWILCLVSVTSTVVLRYCAASREKYSYSRGLGSWCMFSCFTTMSKVLSCVLCRAAWNSSVDWTCRDIFLENERCSFFKILNFNDTCRFWGKNSLGVMGCVVFTRCRGVLRSRTGLPVPPSQLINITRLPGSLPVPEMSGLVPWLSGSGLLLRHPVGEKVLRMVDFCDKFHGRRPHWRGVNLIIFTLLI